MNFPEYLAFHGASMGEDAVREIKPVVSPDLEISVTSKLGMVCAIASGTTIGPRTYVGGDSRLGFGVNIGPGSTIDRRSDIGDYTFIFNDVDVIAGVIRMGSVIGPQVKLSPEVQLGTNAVVPTGSTVATLGRFGENNRMVTIHGSFGGPRYSIGCQDSVSWQTISKRIRHGTETSLESAAHYAKYLDIFNEVGSLVQREFDGSTPLINDILSKATDISGYRYTEILSQLGS